MPSAFKPTGKRGSWFAEWEGRSYPCIHSRYRAGERRQRYDDPSAVPSDQKRRQLIDAISNGKIVIETSDVVRADDPHRTAKRLGYVGLWEIDEVSVSPSAEPDGHFHLRFRFVRRLAG